MNRLGDIKKVSGKRLIFALLFVALVMQLVRASVGTFSVVQGVSMSPTFEPNDVLQVTAPGALTSRGDVVIMTDGNGDRVVKRIIGLPGETVTIYRGFVYINGRRLSEPYLPGHTYTFESNTRVVRRADWALRDNQFFVLGDNRLRSFDSRMFGPVERGQIHGNVILPPNAARPEFCGVLLSVDGKISSVESTAGQSFSLGYLPKRPAKI